MATAEARAAPRPALRVACVCADASPSQAAEESYGSRAFWDARYEDSASTLFDWYQDYEALAQLLLVRRGRRGAARGSS